MQKNEKIDILSLVFMPFTGNKSPGAKKGSDEWQCDNFTNIFWLKRTFKPYRVWVCSVSINQILILLRYCWLFFPIWPNWAVAPVSATLPVTAPFYRHNSLMKSFSKEHKPPIFICPKLSRQYIAVENIKYVIHFWICFFRFVHLNYLVSLAFELF